MFGASQIRQNWELLWALRADLRLGALLACAAVPFAVWGLAQAGLVPAGLAAAMGWAALSAVLVALGLAWVLAAGQVWLARRLLFLARGLFQAEGAQLLLVGPGDRVLWAEGPVPAKHAKTLPAAMGHWLADPPPVIARLAAQLETAPQASDVAFTRHSGLRIAAWRLGPKLCLWHLVPMVAPQAAPVAQASGAPYLCFSALGTLLAMNAAAARILGPGPHDRGAILAPGAVSGQVMQVPTLQGSQTFLVHVIEAIDRSEIYLLAPPGAPSAPPAERLFHELPVAMLRLQADGVIRMANPTACQLLQVDECAGRPLSSVMEGLGRSIGDWLSDAMADRMSRQTEFLRLTGTRDEVFAQVTLHPMQDNGTPALLAVLSDATDFKALEAQFVQSQKMQAVGELAGGVVHDFNNLLTAISGYCDLLLMRHDEGDPDYADLVQITQNANRAAALVGQLLAFSRKQTLRPQVLDMRDTLADLTHLLNRLVGEKLALDLQHAPGLRPIRVDKRQLEQVIMNLVVNARDAMPAGGTIRLETEAVHLPSGLERDHAVMPAGDYVAIRVCDYGVGIPESLRRRVFEPFFSTKPPGQGTGLGLSTVYGIVKQSGGFIFLDSVEGIGTTFTLYFPVYAGPDLADPPMPVQSPPRPKPGAQGLILLVEDELPVRGFAARALRLGGHTVLEAGSGEEALDLLADPLLQPDLVVTDVVMPGLDGPGWVRQALKSRPGLRVIFMSGYAEESFSEDALGLAHSTFLPKPFSLADLGATVAEQMAQALGGRDGVP